MNKNKISLNEKLGRLLQHIQKGDPFLIITADSAKYSKKDNRWRGKQLEYEIVKVFGFSFTKCIGGYVEIGEDGEKIYKDDERSLIVYGDKDREYDLKKFALYAGKKYEQQAVLYCNSKGKAFFINTSGDGGSVLTRLGSFHINGISDYFSRIGKDYFRFEVDDELVESINQITPKPSVSQMIGLNRFRNEYKKISESKGRKTFYNKYLKWWL